MGADMADIGDEFRGGVGEAGVRDVESWVGFEMSCTCLMMISCLPAAGNNLET